MRHAVRCPLARSTVAAGPQTKTGPQTRTWIAGSLAAFVLLPLVLPTVALRTAVAEAPVTGREAATEEPPTETARRHARFRELVTGVTLVGRFTIDRDAAGDPAPSPSGDAAAPDAEAPAADASRKRGELPLREEEYAISGAVPLGGDLWVITARIRYGDKDVTVPVPVAVKWAGDTPVITLDTITIPGLGTFSSRVVLDGARYAGTWQHDDVGGHMFGRIERRPEPER